MKYRYEKHVEAGLLHNFAVVLLVRSQGKVDRSHGVDIIGSITAADEISQRQKCTAVSKVSCKAEVVYCILATRSSLCMV